ncbi:MAG TPA: DUF1338 domain-containing protein [Kofleriaceae bacterium]
MTTVELLELLWRDYVAAAPQAEEIHAILTGRGEILCNDHVALRTFAVPGIGGDALARPFAALGWRPGGCYEFLGGLRARAWQHDDPALPRILISELAIDHLSPRAQAVIGTLVDQLPDRFCERGDLAWAGRPWRVAYADYQALRAESAYAAWVAAFGFLVNHFTIDAGALSTFPDLAALGAFLVEHGFALDDPGTIRGSRGERIERAATRPDPVAVEFADTIARIPSCHYELVRRFPMPSGELFTGFVAASAGAAA